MTNLNPSTSVKDGAKFIAAKRIETLVEYKSDPFMGYKSLDEATQDCKASSQLEVLARLFNRENIFISGPAGSGKSHIIKRFASHMDAEFDGKANIEITASTGIAAKLIGGRTIHSWSGMGLATEEFHRSNVTRGEWAAKERIVNADVVVIDEISMLPAYVLERLDGLMKFHRRNKRPFGGVQMVFMGDFLQLPPVQGRGSQDLDCRFAIFSDAWQNAEVKYCYLDKVRRATDNKLKYLLRRISTGKMDDIAKDLIKSRLGEEKHKNPNKTYATLFTTNKDVDSYNLQKFNENPNPSKKYEIQVSGDPKYYDKILKDQGVPEVIELKVGTTVIVTANITADVVNGSIGVVEKILPHGVIVYLNNGGSVFIDPRVYAHTHKVETQKENSETGESMIVEHILATVEQLPLKLGYAISVHKSQGQTFDGVVVDLSKCFTSGLGYVAISRVKTLNDLIITSVKDSAYKMDAKSIKVNKFVRRKALESRQELEENKEDYEAILENDFIRLIKWPIEDREEKQNTF